ncbi:MAG: hypothetical protein FWH28_04010 [Clostridiales bacterium]|nr:hypothetical protein [Clostridiales bacterium]
MERIIRSILQSDTDLYELPLPDTVQIKSKFNEFIPPNLLRKQFIEDYLDWEGLRDALLSP